MVLNLLVAAIYVVMGTFNGLITFVGISEYFFWLLCAVGLLILRRKVSSPGKRLNSSNVSFGYKTWTFNPVIFTCFSSLVVLRGMISDPLQAVAIVGVMGVGWAIWQISKSNSSGSDISRGEYSSLAIDGINATTSTAP
jgi:solute carrier family 7 (L-type amino acid transporter), member 6